MADNYLERKREEYEQKVAQMQRRPNVVRSANKHASYPTDAQFSQRLHPLPDEALSITPPSRFTYPFDYSPHKLSLLAAQETQQYIATRDDWRSELEAGKMFGVLVVRTRQGEMGFFAAYSGLLAGSYQQTYFVPPVYDCQQPGGFFRQGEAEIENLTRQINEREQSETYQLLLKTVAHTRQEAECSLHDMRQQMNRSRNLRRLKRESEKLTTEELEQLVRESQFQKAEYRRAERAWKERIAIPQTTLDTYEAETERLRTERRKRSAALQMRLFWHYKLYNARGQRKDLCEIFARTPQGTPPAGSGDCAAPKLLQYAYIHRCQPICMAEFWWGNSPMGELRVHGRYYPACTGKCGPILTYMLDGLAVDTPPTTERRTMAEGQTLPIIYEDAWLLAVDKPAGLLSVPGRDGGDSVLQRMRTYLPQADGPLIVHRLDMDTSGLLLIAKTKAVHQRMQALFETRAVVKRYIALLDGTPSADKGLIDLPIGPCLHDRPRQQADGPTARPALTRYEVLEQQEEHTRVAFYPLTGRTHQLRVHAAHIRGLGCPISGDSLYGTRGPRLYLHAEQLEFEHPVTHEHLRLHSPAPF